MIAATEQRKAPTVERQPRLYLIVVHQVALAESLQEFSYLEL